MRKLDFEKLQANDFVDLDSLITKFKEYCVEVLEYSEAEANVISAEMKVPYTASYIFEEFEALVKLDGVEYEVRSCYTNFDYCGEFLPESVKPFEFYTLYDRSTIKNNTGAEYIQARKLFIV